jgi:hypothetical protein
MLYAARTHRGNPHIRDGGPFYRSIQEIVRGDLSEFLHSKFFSVVRNPYVRLLSAYLDKVVPPRDAQVWYPFARRFRVSGDYRPSLAEFLELIVTEEPALLDPHFCPQHINLLHPLAPLDFVARLENHDEMKSFFCERGIHIETHKPHETHALEKVKAYFGPRETELAYALYRRDFEFYGYSSDPGTPDPTGPVTDLRPRRDALRAFVTVYAGTSRDERNAAFSELNELCPAILTEYLMLDAGNLTLEEIRALGNRAIREEITNWRFVYRIGLELAKWEMIDEAVSVFYRCKTMRDR